MFCADTCPCLECDLLKHLPISRFLPFMSKALDSLSFVFIFKIIIGEFFEQDVAKCVPTFDPVFLKGDCAA